MADQRRDPRSALAGGTARRGASRRAARQAQDLSRRSAGRRQDLRDAAVRRRRSGARAIDVVVGVVETHGRRGDRGAARRPRNHSPPEVDYKGHRLAEMDLDAILARRPQLVLVDELRTPTRRAAAIPSAISMSRS